MRAAIFAAVCVTTAALGHALMSVQPLPWWALVASLGVTGLAAWWLAGRERGGFVVTSSTVVAQLALHSLFVLAQSRHAGLDWQTSHTPSATPMGGMPVMSGLVGMADMPTASAARMADMDAMHRDTSQMQVLHSGHGTLGMFLAHALAALVCGLWMWRGEAAASRLARSVVAVLFAPLLVLTTLGRTGLKPTARPVADIGHVLHLRGVLLHHSLSRRGPPRCSSSC